MPNTYIKYNFFHLSTVKEHISFIIVENGKKIAPVFWHLNKQHVNEYLFCVTRAKVSVFHADSR